MNATKTRHLDTAIGILKGKGGAKRPARKGIQVTAYTTSEGLYVVQVNGKVVEQAEGDALAAREAAERRAEAIRKAKPGTNVLVNIY